MAQLRCYVANAENLYAINVDMLLEILYIVKPAPNKELYNTN